MRRVVKPLEALLTSHKRIVIKDSAVSVYVCACRVCVCVCVLVSVCRVRVCLCGCCEMLLLSR